MPIIHYKFADGHTEEIEVTEEIAAAFEQLEKYERAVSQKILSNIKAIKGGCCSRQSLFACFYKCLLIDANEQ